MKLDLYGKDYLANLKNPIDEASNFAQRLIDMNIKKPKLAFKAYSTLIKLYIRRKKPLLCLRALKKLIRTNHNALETHLFKI